MMIVVKNPLASAGDVKVKGLIPGSGRCLEEGMAAHSSIFPREFHGQWSLAGYSLGHKESDMIEVT